MIKNIWIFLLKIKLLPQAIQTRFKNEILFEIDITFIGNYIYH